MKDRNKGELQPKVFQGFQVGRKRLFKTIGPHVAHIPPQLKIVKTGKAEDPALTPIHKAIEKAEAEGWRFLEYIPCVLPLTIGAGNVMQPNGRKNQIQLPGVLALMVKTVINNDGKI